MQEKSICSNDAKPSKHELHYMIPKQFNIRTCPDCDTKRTGLCKDPNCQHPNQLH